MYKYKLVNNYEFKIAYGKYLRKNLLIVSLTSVSVVNLILFLLFYFFLKVYESQINFFPFIISIILILEALLFYISYKIESKKMLNSVTNSETTISFDEKGISLYQDSILKHINWKAVRNVIIDGDNLLFQFKVIGLPGNFFYLKFFDSEREELIKDIEKYIQVKEHK